MNLLNIIFPEAHAQAAPSGLQGLDLMSLAPFIILFVAFYFLVIRPQTKKAKEHREMLGALRRGDQIITAGGIIGTISKIENDNELVVEISPNVNVRVIRSMIAQVLTKTQPLNTKEQTQTEGAVKSKKSTVAVLKNSKKATSSEKPTVQKRKK